MNWTRVVLSGVVAGIVMNIVEFVEHGVILADTYKKYSPQPFTATEANPGYFALIAVLTGIAAAILFAKTRQSWADGWKGGVTFAFFGALVSIWANFHQPLVIEGFPYYLAWCWSGSQMIAGLAGGAGLGVMLRRST